MRETTEGHYSYLTTFKLRNNIAMTIATTSYFRRESNLLFFSNSSHSSFHVNFDRKSSPENCAITRTGGLVTVQF